MEDGYVPPDLVYWCPGCQCGHGIWLVKKNGKDAVWQCVSRGETLTFQPSFMHERTDESGKRFVCHLFIRDHKLQFLGDCTHALADKTVPMELF